jgi:HSP20 family protein
MNSLARFNNFSGFDNLFDLFFHKSELPDYKEKARTLSPSLNAKEDEKQILLSFELPGFSKEDIDISLEDNELVVSAEHKEEREENGSKWLRKEISTGIYVRRLSLPDNINANKISAESNNGILTVSIPKVPKEETVKKITVKGV